MEFGESATDCNALTNFCIDALQTGGRITEQIVDARRRAAYVFDWLGARRAARRGQEENCRKRD